MGELLQFRDAHDEVQLLLPWRVNGTLSPQEAEMTEAHLAECAVCRADLAAQLSLRQAYAQMPGDTAPNRREVARPIARRFSPPGGSRWRSLRRRVGAGVAGTGQAALAAAAAAALVILVLPSQKDDEYRLLGSAPTGARGNAIVLFSPDASERDLRIALNQVGARVVDGPTASGAYVVRLDAARRAAALRRLRGLPQVVLAEPMDSADTR